MEDTRENEARLVGMLRVAAMLVVLAVASGSAPQTPVRAQTKRAEANGISTGIARKGELVYRKQGCDRCHGTRGEGVVLPGSTIAVPPIASTRLELPNFIQSIRKPKGQMPAYAVHQISDQQLVDVYQFLKAVVLVPVPVTSAIANPAVVANGQILFAKYGCSECHLSHGQGSRITGSRLGPPQMPASGFIRYVRVPTGEMPPYTAKTVTDQELEAMYGFLLSVPAPPSWKIIPLLNQ